MAQLPEDVYHQIFAQLLRQTLSNCRLANRQVGSIATYHAFRHVRLAAAYDVQKFVNITTSKALQDVVREVTIDTWMGPEFLYHQNKTFRPPRDFFRALAYLRTLRNLKVVNLRFNSRCGVDVRNNISIEETYDFRYLVLDIVFSCLAGKWPQANRPIREESLVSFSPNDRGTLPPIPTEGILEMDGESMEPIEINTLTVSNLADFNDERLTMSEAFKQVISSKSLTSLQLLVATETVDAAPETSICFPEKYHFFNSLHKTWLSPALAQNIKTLSFFFSDYWGWNPKMDFRTINPGTGADSGLPNLRVLALGNYVFSHQWQVEWVATLVGHQNGRGGLEELYLHDCPIMWQARTLQPMDDSTTVYKQPNGELLVYSNSGYPLQETMINQQATWNAEKISYHLRWNMILDHWRKNMKSLKVFKMGHGASGSSGTFLRERALYEELSIATTTSGFPEWSQEMKHLTQQFEDTVHLTYDCPSPPLVVDADSVHDRKYIHGVGILHNREHILQYVHFDIGLGLTQWVERDNGPEMCREHGRAEYEAARARDEIAYEEMMRTIWERA